MRENKQISLRGAKYHHKIYIYKKTTQIMKFKKYVFRRYCGEYPKLFRKEKRKLIKALGNNVVIEHVGSTAIPGLGGKGIIDIAIKTPKSKASRYKDILKKLGYKTSLKHPEDNRRIFLQRKIRYSGKERRVHVHLTLKKKFWDTFIIFRDKLNKNPELIKEYENLKRKAVKIARGDGQAYRDYKSKFLKKHSK